jgi:hypothetical protein
MAQEASRLGRTGTAWDDSDSEGDTPVVLGFETQPVGLPLGESLSSTFSGIAARPPVSTSTRWLPHVSDCHCSAPCGKIGRQSTMCRAASCECCRSATSKL